MQPFPLFKSIRSTNTARFYHSFVFSCKYFCHEGFSFPMSRHWASANFQAELLNSAVNLTATTVLFVMVWISVFSAFHVIDILFTSYFLLFVYNITLKTYFGKYNLEIFANIILLCIIIMSCNTWIETYCLCITSTLGRFRNSFYAEPACNVFTSYRLTAHPCISRRRPFPLFSHFHPHSDTAIAVELQGDKRGKVVKFDTAAVFFPNVSVLIPIHFHSKHLLKRFLK